MLLVHFAFEHRTIQWILGDMEVFRVNCQKTEREDLRNVVRALAVSAWWLTARLSSSLAWSLQRRRSLLCRPESWGTISSSLRCLFLYTASTNTREPYLRWKNACFNSYFLQTFFNVLENFSAAKAHEPVDSLVNFIRKAAANFWTCWTS
jgi:hypothetical protein